MVELIARDCRTRVLLAVMAGARTTTEIAAAAGCGRPRAHAHLEALRREGLVTWERGRQGTIRPLVVGNLPREADDVR